LSALSASHDIRSCATALEVSLGHLWPAVDQPVFSPNHRQRNPTHKTNKLTTHLQTNKQTNARYTPSPTWTFPQPRGIHIAKIFDGSPAERAGGLTAGDVIVTINGKPVVDVTHAEAVAIIKSTFDRRCVAMAARIRGVAIMLVCVGVGGYMCVCGVCVCVCVYVCVCVCVCVCV
jgi:hypothetical protein